MTSIYINHCFPYIVVLLLCFFTHIHQTKVNADFDSLNSYHTLSEKEASGSQILGEENIYNINENESLKPSSNKYRRSDVLYFSPAYPISDLFVSRRKISKGNLKEYSSILNNTTLFYSTDTRKLQHLNAVNPNFSMKFYIPKVQNNPERSTSDTIHDTMKTHDHIKETSDNESLRFIDCNLLNEYLSEASHTDFDEIKEKNSKGQTNSEHHNSTHLRFRNTGPKLRWLKQKLNETMDTAKFITLEPHRQNTFGMLSKDIRHSSSNSTSRHHKFLLLDNLTRVNLFNSSRIRLLPSYSANITATENKIQLPHPNISRQLSKLTEFGEERLENGKKIVSKYLQRLNTTKQTLKHKMSSIKEKSSISTDNRAPFRSLNRPPFSSEIYPKVQNAVLPQPSDYLNIYNSNVQEGTATNETEALLGLSKADDFSMNTLDPKVLFYAMEIQNAIKSIQQSNELATQCRFIALLQYLMLTGRVYQPSEKSKNESLLNCLNFCSFNHLSDLLDSSVSLSKSAEILKHHLPTSNQLNTDTTNETLEEEKNLTAASIEEAEKSRISLNKILAELEAIQIILTKGESSTYFQLVTKLKNLYLNPPLENREEEFTTAIEDIQKFIERLQLYWHLDDENMEIVKNIRMRCNEILNMIDSNVFDNNYEDFDTQVYQLIQILETIHLELHPSLLYTPYTSNSDNQQNDTKYILTFAQNDIFEDLTAASTNNHLKNKKEFQDKKVEQLISQFQMEPTKNINEIGLNLLKRLRQNSFLGYEQISNLRDKVTKIINNIPDRLNHTRTLTLLPAVLFSALYEQGRDAGRIHLLLDRVKMSRMRQSENEPNSDSNVPTVRDALINLKSAIFDVPHKFRNIERRERYLKRLLDNKFANVRDCVTKHNVVENNTTLDYTDASFQESHDDNDSNTSKDQIRSLRKMAPDTSKLPNKTHILHLKKLNIQDLLQTSNKARHILIHHPYNKLTPITPDPTIHK